MGGVHVVCNLVSGARGLFRGIVRVGSVSAVGLYVLVVLVPNRLRYKCGIAPAFFILCTKRNVWLMFAWFCVLFVYQFVIDMNVSRCRGVPAVVSFRLCVDCNKLNQLQAHFPRKFGAVAV